MPLRVRSGAISVAFGTVSFFMADNDKTIRVDVGQDVLAKIGSSPPKTREGYAQLITRFRRHFERIAAFKYDEGDYRPEVRVLVVNITHSDFS